MFDDTVNNHCHAELTYLTHDAMWCNKLGTPVPLSNINASFHTHEEVIVTEEDKTDFVWPAMDDVRDTARKAQETLQNPPTEVTTFLEKYRPLLLTAGVTILLFKIEKRMVKKVVRRELFAALSNTPVRIDVRAYLSDLEAHEVAKRASWLAKHPY